MDDQSAITRIRQGDPNGLEPLVRRYQVKATYSAYLILHDRSRAEEVVQSAFLKVFDHVHQFQDNRPFSPWFFRIVINDAIKTAIRLNREIQVSNDEEEIVFASAWWCNENLSSVEDTVIDNETEEQLWQAIKRLPISQREVIVKRYFLHLPEAEIARQMSSPLSSIKWWLRQARKTLGEWINPGETKTGERGWYE